MLALLNSLSPCRISTMRWAFSGTGGRLEGGRFRDAILLLAEFPAGETTASLISLSLESDKNRFDRRIVDGTNTFLWRKEESPLGANAWTRFMLKLITVMIKNELIQNTILSSIFNHNRLRTMRVQRSLFL